ncbi:MAG TPA: aspartate-alanine antiporter [Candidatus Acidoferrales bacterium]|jgi:putative transport protein|nr:aspartate-alanine antiporter [Candidatus Acidoferrales bacterium]
MDWFVATLRQYPEIALFLSLGIGYWVGGKSFKGFSLGSVTATLLAAIAIGQFGIKVSPDLKATFFLLFLFAIGYGVGPQFIRGITKDGLPQAIYAVIVCIFCLGASVGVAKIAGYDAGAAAGLFAGSQTISASMGLATDAINRLGVSADQTKAMLDIMPTAYAITYIFGTVGSAIVVAILGPVLLRINLPKAAKEYEEAHGGRRELGGLGDAWQAYDVRAFKIAPDAQVVGKTVAQAEAYLTEATAALGNRMYILGVRRGQTILDATSDLILQPGDTASVVGERDQVIALLGQASKEVDDPELLSAPIEGIDVYVTSKEADGKTLAELGALPGARGVYVRSIKRGLGETPIPVLGDTKIYRGDVVKLVGRTEDTSVAGKALGVIDRASDIADVAFIGIAITIGALIGAIVLKVGGIPITLSTAGGALILGIIAGWYRSVRPTFGRIPTPTLWFMNSVGLNMFIAVIGLTAGPKFVAGLQQLGFGLFLWGVVATSVPLILGMYLAKYVFRFHDAITLGAISGARTTTASLGMVCDAARSQVPGLGYTVTYAVGNTLLTIWGMFMVMLVH